MQPTYPDPPPIFYPQQVARRDVIDLMSITPALYSPTVFCFYVIDDGLFLPVPASDHLSYPPPP